MKSKKIAFYPYEKKNSNSMNLYIKNIEKILENKGTLYSYEHGLKSIGSMLKCKYIFLNWYENGVTLVDYCVLILARLLRKKIVWTFHNKIPHDSCNLAREKKKIFFISRISTHILILSKHSRKELYRISGEQVASKVVYVPHINYCNDYKPTKCSEEVKKIESEFTFLYFGQIRPYKNIEVLIRAFAEMKGKCVKLIIAGKPYDAEYAKKIRDMCINCFHIVLDYRFIPDQKVYDYMQSADVVILPYNKQSSMNSGAMIAAFSCRKPVIVPDIAMARDYSNKEYVYMYHYQNQEQHIKELNRVMEQAYLQGKEKNRKLGEQAYLDVKEKNSSEEVTRCLSVVW